MRKLLALAFVLVAALMPYELAASTLEGELLIRSAASLVLVLLCRSLLTKSCFIVIASCEAVAIAYNLAIALGYFFTDDQAAMVYAHVMLSMFCIQIIAITTSKHVADPRTDRSGTHSRTPSSDRGLHRQRLAEAE